MDETRKLKLEMAALKRELASQRRRMAQIEERRRQTESVVTSLTTHFLYICLHWLKCRDQAGVDGWRSRKNQQMAWFEFTESIFPSSKEELREALNEYKRQLGQ